MKKTIPFMLSVLAIASIASIAVLGNTQTAYAGNGCTLSPNAVTLDLFLDESVTLEKVIDCVPDTIAETIINPLECGPLGIDILISNTQNPVLGVRTFDETIINTGGSPVTIHCQVTIEVENLNNLVQDIWVTTKIPVGGELLPIDNAALLLAGLQTSAIWMLPVLAGVAGSAFGILYIKSKRN